MGIDQVCSVVALRGGGRGGFKLVNIFVVFWGFGGGGFWYYLFDRSIKFLPFRMGSNAAYTIVAAPCSGVLVLNSFQPSAFPIFLSAASWVGISKGKERSFWRGGGGDLT